MSRKRPVKKKDAPAIAAPDIEEFFSDQDKEYGAKLDRFFSDQSRGGSKAVQEAAEVRALLLSAFEKQLGEYNSECLGAFQDLVRAGCSAECLMYAVKSVEGAFSHHARLEGNPLPKEGADESDEACWERDEPELTELTLDLAEKAARMNKHKIRTLRDKTRWVARKWEQQFQAPFGKEIVRLARSRDSSASEDDFLNVPRRLLALAECAKDIHAGTEHRRRPVYDDALARLVEYVRLTANKDHDREVSALVSFARRDSYHETDHRPWKHDHLDVLRRARLKLAQKH
jgi:hypothetical protein